MVKFLKIDELIMMLRKRHASKELQRVTALEVIEKDYDINVLNYFLLFAREVMKWNREAETVCECIQLQFGS